MRNHLGRKLTCLGEYYVIYILASYSAWDFSYTKRNKVIEDQFIERIMLAVTQVNDCPICSYAHSKMALEADMSNQEIQKMLAGVQDDVPEVEAAAIIFAQHYADTRGKPSQASWRRLKATYTSKEARAILAAIRIIMFGNAAGIAWGSFVNRFKKEGKIDERSRLTYEVAMVLSTILYLPFAVVHGSILRVFARKEMRFKNE